MNELERAYKQRGEIINHLSQQLSDMKQVILDGENKQAWFLRKLHDKDEEINRLKLEHRRLKQLNRQLAF